MKKRFLERHSANALLKGRSLLAGAGLLLLAVIILGLRLIAPQFLITIAAPVVHAGTFTSHAFHTFSDSFTERLTLVNQRDALLRDIEAHAANERMLTERVHDLERLIGQRHGTTPEILASVLMRPPVSPYDILVVDSGSADGVSAGAFAFGPDGVPLGTVQSVTEKTARVSLFSTSGRETEAWVGAERVPLTLTGEGAGTFSATVSKDAKIQEGDSVTIPGGASAPIGKILKITTNPSSPLVELFITPFSNPFSITWISIAQQPL